MKKLTTLVSGLVLVLPLAACGNGEQQALRQWMAESAKNLKGAVPALPAVKPYAPFDYAAKELKDAFQTSKIDPESVTHGGKRVDFLKPGTDHRKEPLEAFPLESLKMVGTLQQDRTTYALIRADNNLYRVKSGNYLGGNFGKIEGISETEVTIKEAVQDSDGDWTERTSTLQLSEQEATRK
jgi:type IV pilus assembly protein PilP